MIGAFRYAAALAGSRAGLATLLRDDEWRRLKDAKDFEGILSVLSSTSYAASLPAKDPHPDDLERAFARRLSRMTYAPLPFLHGTPSETYDMVWRSYELDDLFAVLRGVHNGAAPRRIRSSLRPLGAPSAIDWRSLSSAGSIDEVIRQIEKTPSGALYGALLRQARNAYHRSRQVAVLEISVNRGYQARLRDLVGSLTGADRKSAEGIVGTMIDAQLLLSAARYRVFFDWSTEEIMGASLDRGIALETGHLRHVATGGDVLPIIREIWGERVTGFEDLRSLSERDRLVRLELLFLRYRHSLALEELAGYRFGFGPLLGYVALLEDEVHDILATVEGVVEGWQPSDIERQLIGATRRGSP